jgi:RNA polymerase sigma-70 factor (ECF subfamily)
MRRLKPRERELLWLAYAEGASHKEIADVMGLRASSVRLLLFRARQKALKLLPRSWQAATSQTDKKSLFKAVE